MSAQPFSCWVKDALNLPRSEGECPAAIDSAVHESTGVKGKIDPNIAVRSTVGGISPLAQLAKTKPQVIRERHA